MHLRRREEMARPIREVHRFYPMLHGRKITELQFRTLVKAMHCIY
jgi:hypothetical protein